MIVLSDQFAQEDSEGCRKVAQSLANGCKQRDRDTLLVSINSKALCADAVIKTNRLLLSPALARLLRKRKDTLLYIPGSAGTPAGILRICVLSLMNRGRVRALFSGLHETNGCFRWLLKCSGAEILTLSEETCRYYQNFAAKATRLKTGVDTKKFSPVTPERKRELRKKYGFGPEERILLHVGHMQEGRNLRCLSRLEGTVLLVLSPATREAEDAQLREALSGCPNVVLMDRYLPDIQEVYQLSDVYLFPVQEPGHCIDTPLSALEAMACGLPLVASDFGELKAFRGVPGVCIVDSFEKQTLENAMDAVLGTSARQAVLAYDWHRTVEALRKERKL